jgi:hypothetical protein
MPAARKLKQAAAAVNPPAAKGSIGKKVSGFFKKLFGG